MEKYPLVKINNKKTPGPSYSEVLFIVMVTYWLVGDEALMKEN